MAKGADRFSDGILPLPLLSLLQCVVKRPLAPILSAALFEAPNATITYIIDSLVSDKFRGHSGGAVR